MRKPDYAGGGIANLMASLIGGLGGTPGQCGQLDMLGWAEVAAFRNIVLVVLDGLGHDWLLRQTVAPWLRKHLRGSMTSVFPSTTATAVTTFLTGEPPQQHGLTGWHIYFRELGTVLAVLPGRARYGGVGLGDAGISAQRLFNHVPLCDRLTVRCHVLSPAHIAHSDFNLTHLGQAHLWPYRGFDTMLEIAASVARQDRDRKFIYAYWPDLDAVGHTEGMNSAAAAEQLRLIDDALSRFAGELAGTDSLLIVTADHGQIDTRPEDRITLDDHPELSDMLALPLCGESRVAYCYVRPRRLADFEHYVTDRLGHAAEMVPSARLLEEGWFGPGVPHPALADRIGDYTLIMKGHHVIKDWLPQERRHELIGVHGGVTDEEMLVPLAALGT